MATPRTAGSATQTRTPSAQTVPSRTPSGVPPAQPTPVTRVPSARPGTPAASPSLAPRTTPTPASAQSGTTPRGVPPAAGSNPPGTATTPVVRGVTPTATRTTPTVPAGSPGRTAPGITPVARQPSQHFGSARTNPPDAALQTSPAAVRSTRAPTGASADIAAGAAAASSRTAPTVSARTVAQRTPTGGDPAVPARTPMSASALQASRNVQRARRVSKVIVEKEKKTDYWQEIIEEARLDAPELSQEDVNNMIARCLSLELVANWKVREADGTAPRAKELFNQLETTMEDKLTERNGGTPLPIPGTGFTKIKNMERALQILEQKAEKEQEDEAEKVKAKITELTKTLANVQQKKEQEREQNRRTMTMEINNLREQMQKAATEPAVDPSKMMEENKKMAQKMARLEAALRQMNEERKKGADDNDSAMLKKKLALFESRMKQLEEEKKMKESEEHTDNMRDKLLLMEEKLSKMEKRKSVSITMMMQQKMQQVEEQLSSLRNSGQTGSSSKIAELEKKLVEMQNTKVNPAMINDPETRALRSHIKKMEEAMLAAEKKMETDRLRLEEERKLALEKRQREEELYRKKAQQREQLLLDKMAEMEKRIAASSRGGPPPPPGAAAANNAAMDAALQQRLAEMEKRLAGGSAFADKMAEMERRLQETEARLMKEKQTSSMLLSVLENKEGPELEACEKDIKIALLTQSTQDLMKRLEETAKQMDDKFAAVTKKIDTMQFTGGGPAAPVHKSGLSYAEINQKLEEIQTKLFNPDIEERESEQLNIEYEKLISELEATAEYKAEQDAIAKKWKEENLPLNAAALERVKAEIASWTPMKKTAQLKRKPELKFLDFTPDQINKKHVNDFKGVTTQNLTLDEARALYANMPEFRKDQEAQLQFFEQLKQKIETEAKKPAVKPPPPIKANKAVVFKKPPPPKGGGGEPGDFLGELLKKRKPVG